MPGKSRDQKYKISEWKLLNSDRVGNLTHLMELLSQLFSQNPVFKGLRPESPPIIMRPAWHIANCSIVEV